MAVRDKEWLTLEACREFQRGTCSRTDQECKYAHPSNTVVVENGRVIACYDSMKGQCTRENCRYLHPPPHLKTQLEIKGQNNIAARRMLQNAALQNQLLGQPGTIPIHQPTILSTVPTSLPSGASPVAASTSQASMDAATAAAYHYPGHHHPYMFPVAVSMAPTMSHSTLSQHMYPASYFSQAVQTLPTVPTSTTMPGSGTNAHPGFSEIPIQAPIIPSAPGAPFQFFPVKAKNDRLELPTTNRKRPREEDDQLLLMWNYLKDDPARWQSPSEYNSYIQNHQSLSACLPRPAKMPATFPHHQHHQLAQLPGYPSNLLYNPLAPMTVMTQPQFLPGTLPMNMNMNMMPTPFPFLAPHILHNQNTSESLPVCRDFKSGNCKRPNCKYAHVMEDKVEIVEGKVTLCRDAAKGKCMRTNCKYYHVPGTTAANGLLPATAIATTAASATTY